MFLPPGMERETINHPFLVFFFSHHAFLGFPLLSLFTHSLIYSRWCMEDWDYATLDGRQDSIFVICYTLMTKIGKSPNEDEKRLTSNWKESSWFNRCSIYTGRMSVSLFFVSFVHIDVCVVLSSAANLVWWKRKTSNLNKSFPETLSGLA